MAGLTTLLIPVLSAYVALAAVTSASVDEKMVPISIGISEGFGQQQQPVTGGQPYATMYPGGPPAYGNDPGPSENAIAPPVNPYPRITHCVTTGIMPCSCLIA